MQRRPLTVAWCSYFPIEWLPDAPELIRKLPKRHPASWLQSCAGELGRRPDEIKLHVIELSKGIAQDLSFEAGGATIHCLKVPGGGRAASLFWLDTFLIRRKLKQIQPAALHAWGTEKGAALVGTRLTVPCLVSVQGLMEYYATVQKLTTYEKFITHFEKVSLRRAAVASGESTFVAKWLREHYPHLQVHHVEHSPGWSFWKVQRAPEIKPLRFLFIGTTSFRKGSDLLVQALDALKAEIDFRLTIVEVAPNPAMLVDLKSQTSPALWSRIDFLHGAGPEQVGEQLRRASMVLFPTRADTGPVAVKEAAVAGVPVVGSATGGIPDYVRSGKNGLTFPLGDLAGFISAIREACAHPLFSRGEVDPSTLAGVRDHLSPARMADGFLQIYKTLAPSPLCPY